MNNNGNIILIGFMGVGKGTIARALVKESELFAIDTDDLIESIEKRAIKKIFQRDGEEYFREVEKKVAIWLEKNVTNSIISTGGGFYKVPNLKNIGTVVYLYGEFDWIIERLTNHPNSVKKFKKRPLLKNLSRAKALYEERAPIYANLADITIDTKQKSPEAVVAEIKERLKIRK